MNRVGVEEKVNDEVARTRASAQPESAAQEQAFGVVSHEPRATATILEGTMQNSRPLHALAK